MKTLADFEPLKPAEQKLLECCQSGEVAVIGEERPIEKTEVNEIRAAFLRWLILFSKIEIDPKGIEIKGAWVSGEFNLENSECSYTLKCLNSVFDKQVWFVFAITKSIDMNGSLLMKGMRADGLICKGNVSFREGFKSEDEVRFLGAHIEGSLKCKNATFQVLEEIKKPLNIRRIRITESLFLEKCEVSNGILDLTNANIGVLTDDKEFWEQKTFKVYLDGFCYEHIYKNTSASFRLQNMLAKMLKFEPQPYKQLAKVLRDMGHDRDADEVMIALHDKKLELSNESWWYKVFRKIYKWTSEYGYRPMRTLKIMASIWLLFGCIYWYGANVAVFVPTNPLIFQKQEYNCTIDKNGTKWFASPKDYNASNNWYEASPPEYTTFQPFWYSLDIILPVVDLKMENDWGVVIPSPDGSFFKIFNYFIRFLTWFETLAGWGLSLILVAILSGLAKNEKE